MTGSDLRPIQPIANLGVTANAIEGGVPDLDWCDPKTLLVEPDYQRDLGERSIRLIRKLVAGWDWRAFKAPTCARRPDGKLVVLDGQHSALAAATHPGIDLIPVVIVDAARMADRADAFLKTNRDRLAMTAIQLHRAAATAGEDIATTLDAICAETSVSFSKGHGREFKVGETTAIGALTTMLKSKGRDFTAQVLRVLVNAQRAPLTATEIQAVAELIGDPTRRAEFLDPELSRVVASKSSRAWLSFAETNVRKGLPMPMVKALAIAWFKSVPKVRRAPAKDEGVSPQVAAKPEPPARPTPKQPVFRPSPTTTVGARSLLKSSITGDATAAVLGDPDPQRSALARKTT